MIEMVQYKAALMIAGEIKRMFRDRLYQEVRSKSLADRKWSSSFIPLHEATQAILTFYLQTCCNTVGKGVCLTSLTTQDKTKTIPARSKVSENLFLSYCINFIWKTCPVK